MAEATPPFTPGQVSPANASLRAGLALPNAPRTLRRLLAVVVLVTPSLAFADDGCVQQGAQQQCRMHVYKQVVRSGESLNIVAKCPPGTLVTGGGANLGDNMDTFSVSSNSPLSDGTGWYASAVNISDEKASTTLEAVAICR